jgi:hypothetical protein
MRVTAEYRLHLLSLSSFRQLQLVGILSPLPRKVIPDFAIDNHLRVQKLDHYCKGLCMHLFNARGDADVWGAAEEDGKASSGTVLSCFLHTVYDFVDLEEHCGQRKRGTLQVHNLDASSHGPLDGQALAHSGQEQVYSVLSRGRDPAAALDLPQPASEDECHLLAATEAEVERLLEDLRDADHRVRAHADTKRLLGQQVVAAQAQIPGLRARLELGAQQLKEATHGAGAAGLAAHELSCLARTLDGTACSLVRALEQECAGSACGAARSAGDGRGGEAITRAQDGGEATPGGGHDGQAAHGLEPCSGGTCSSTPPDGGPLRAGEGAEAGATDETKAAASAAVAQAISVICLSLAAHPKFCNFSTSARVAGRHASGGDEGTRRRRRAAKAPPSRDCWLKMCSLPASCNLHGCLCRNSSGWKQPLRAWPGRATGRPVARGRGRGRVRHLRRELVATCC